MGDRWKSDRHLTLTATLVEAVIGQGTCTPSQAAKAIPGLSVHEAATLLYSASKRPEIHKIARICRGHYGSIGNPTSQQHH